jgi:hypothetical protein
LPLCLLSYLCCREASKKRNKERNAPHSEVIYTSQGVPVIHSPQPTTQGYYIYPDNYGYGNRYYADFNAPKIVSRNDELPAYHHVYNQPPTTHQQVYRYPNGFNVV